MIATSYTAMPAATAAPARSISSPTPAPVAVPRDTVKLVGGTIASAAFCGASGAIFCGLGAGVAALVGLPFVGPTAIAAAVGASAIFGGTLSALTLRNSFDPPAGTEDAFKNGRGPVTGNLPNPPRDAASMVLAENAMWQSLDQAARSGSSKEAASLAAAGFERFGTILAHGGERTTSLALGVAVGTAVAGPLLGIPLGIAGGFAASYVLDQPSHWLGSVGGRAVGALAGRVAYARAH